MSTGNSLVPCAICFDWTALFGVLCLGVAEFTWAEGPSYSSDSSGVGITWVTQSGPELSAVTKAHMYEAPSR